MTDSYDIIVIGGGHNGLTCAGFLAKAGRRVLVLEASSSLGGAAANRQLADGVTGPGGAHILHQLHPTVLKQLKLKKHGLKPAGRRLPTISLGRDGKHLVLMDKRIEGLAESGDSEAWRILQKQLQRMARALAPSLAETAPKLGSRNWQDLLSLAKLGLRLRMLGRKDMRDFMRIVNMNVFDLMNDELADDRLKGMLAFDSVLGSNFGPRSPGTVLTLLMRRANEMGNNDGLTIPQGGIGQVAEALAKSAKTFGAEVRTESAIRRILVEDDRACGVELDDGQVIRAGLVVSSADPKRTYLSLVGTEHLDTGFLRRLQAFRSKGIVAKLNLVLNGLPEFTGLNNALLGGRLVVAPDMAYIERAFDHTKYGEYSEAPALEITIPSLHDGSLTEPGKHVMSVIVLYAPYDLKGGWDKGRETFADSVVKLLAEYAPSLPGLVEAREMLTPPDLEREFGMTGGHWHHGDLAIDQMLAFRPVPGFGQYASPISGLYLCGAGTHPGGGVTGLPGMNAARRILAQEAGS